MNFKVITYSCGCKFIYITDPGKRILTEHRLCPECGNVKKHVELFCAGCGKKLTETNLRAWQRKERCSECSRLYQLEKVNAAWRKKQAEKKNRKVKPEDLDLFAMAKRGALRRLYRSMTLDLPSFTLTPTIDKLYEKHLDTLNANVL